MKTNIKSFGIILSAVFCFSFFDGTSKLDPTVSSDKNQVSVIGLANVHTTSFPLEMSNKFLYGGFIDNDLKSRALSKHKTNNYFGLNAQAEIGYLSQIKSVFGIANSFWGAKLTTNYLSFNKYSKDLFDLIFNGNTSSIGTPLSFDDTEFNFQQFNSIGFTYGLNFADVVGSGSIQISATPHLLIGTSFTDISITNGSLLTSANGEEIDIELQANYNTLDTGNASGSLGIGAMIDLNLVYTSDKNTFAFSVTNLGSINWDTQQKYNVDTSFTFSGIEIEDVFNIKDSVIDVAGFQDSLLNNTPSKTSKALPTLFSIYFQHKFTDKLSIKNWANYRLTTSYIPFVMSQVNYNFGSFSTGVSGAYGGYGNFQTGLVIGLHVNAFSINLGTTNALGFISPKTQTSQGVYTKVTYKF